MSRIVNLRTPFSVKVTTSLASRILSSATLHLYVWTGAITNKPTTPTYTQAKRSSRYTDDAGNIQNDFIVFEIAELARDFVDVFFDGDQRITDPVYIGYDILKSYSNDDTVDLESGILFGLDGWNTHSEGLQGFHNLLSMPTVLQSEIDNPEVSITATVDTVLQSSGEFNVEEDSEVVFTAEFTPADAPLQWYKDNQPLSNQTASTLTIPSFEAIDDGVYQARITVDGGTRSSNAITANFAGADVEFVFTLSPSSYVFGAASGDSTEFEAVYTSTKVDITSSEVSAPAWLDVSVAASTTADNMKTSIITLTTNEAYNEADDRPEATLTVTVLGGSDDDIEKTSIVSQLTSQDTSEPPSATLISDATIAMLNTAVNLSLGSLTDPADTSFPAFTYQWYRDGSPIVGATSSTYQASRSTTGADTFMCRIKSVASNKTAFAVYSDGTTSVTVNWYKIPALTIPDDQVGTIDGSTEVTISPEWSDESGGDPINWDWDITSNVSGQSGGGANDDFITFTLPTSGDVVVTVSAESSVSGFEATGVTGTINVAEAAETEAPTISVVTFTVSEDNINYESTNTDSTISGVFTGSAEQTSYLKATPTVSDNNLDIDPVNDLLTYEWRKDAISNDPVSFDLSRTVYSANAGNQTWFFTATSLKKSETIQVNFNFTEPRTLSWTDTDNKKDYTATFQDNASFEIKGNTTYTVQRKVAPKADGSDDGTSWAQIVDDSGTGGTAGSTETNTVLLDIEANDTDSSRSMNLEVRSTSGSPVITDTLLIVQAAQDPGDVTKLSINSDTFPSQGGNLTIKVEADDSASWTVDIDGPNIDASQQGTGDEEFDITIPANSIPSDITIHVEVTGGVGTDITADPSDYDLKQSAYVPGTGGGSIFN